MLVTKREVKQTSKKLLSLLLAVIMVMSSMSICFGVSLTVASAADGTEIPNLVEAFKVDTMKDLTVYRTSTSTSGNNYTLRIDGKDTIANYADYAAVANVMAKLDTAVKSLEEYTTKATHDNSGDCEASRTYCTDFAKIKEALIGELGMGSADRTTYNVDTLLNAVFDMTNATAFSTDENGTQCSARFTNVVTYSTTDVLGYVQYVGDYANLKSTDPMTQTYTIGMSRQNYQTKSGTGVCQSTHNHYHHALNTNNTANKIATSTTVANKDSAGLLSTVTSYATNTVLANYNTYCVASDGFDKLLTLAGKAATDGTDRNQLEVLLASFTGARETITTTVGGEDAYDKLYASIETQYDKFVVDCESALSFADMMPAVEGWKDYENVSHPDYGKFNWGAFVEATIRADYNYFKTNYYDILKQNDTVYNYFINKGEITEAYFTNFHDNVVAFDLYALKINYIDPLYNKFAISFADLDGENEITLLEKQIAYSELTGYINNIGSYSAQVQNAIFPDGIYHLLDLQQKLECQVAECVLYFAENVNKDYSTVSTGDVIAEIETAKSQLEALNALKSSIDEVNYPLLDGSFANADTFIAYLYSLLAERFVAQVDYADEVYTELERPKTLDIITFSKINTALKNIEDVIVETLEAAGKSGLIPAATTAKYNALKDEVYAPYQSFLADRGFRNYNKIEIPDIVRPESEDDVVRTGDYTVTDSDVQEVIDLLESVLKDENIKKILGDLINKDKETGEPFDIAALINGLLEGIYTDDIINLIIQFVYPLVGKEFAKVWAGLPEDFTTVTKAAGMDADVYATLKLFDVNTAISAVGMHLFPSTLGANIRAKYPSYTGVADLLEQVTLKPEFDKAADKFTKNPWESEILYRDSTNDKGEVIIDESTGEVKKELALDWGIDEAEDKRAAFIDAACAALSGLEPLLFALLCNKDYTNPTTTECSNVGIRGAKIGTSGANSTATLSLGTLPLVLDPISLVFQISGNDGYDNVFAPLFEALGLTNIPHGESLTTTKKLLEDGLFGMIDQLVAKLAANPLNTILEILPNLAYVLEADMIQNALSLLEIEIYYEADAYYIATIPSALALVAGLAGLSNPTTGKVEAALKAEKDELDANNNPTGNKVKDPILINLGDMLNLGDLGLDLSSFSAIWNMIGLDIPAPSAAEISLMGTLTAKTTNRSRYAYTYTPADKNSADAGKAWFIEANKSDILIYLLKYVLSPEVLGAFIDLESAAELVQEIINNITATDAGKNNTIAAIVELLDQQAYALRTYNWYNGSYTPSEELGFTPATQIYMNPENDWTKEKAQYLYDNLEALLGAIFTMANLDLDKETEGVQTSLEDLIGGLVNGLFTDKTLTALAGILAKLDLNALLNKDKTPEEAAKAIDVNKLIKDLLGLDLAAVAAQYAATAAALEADPEYVDNSFGVDAAENKAAAFVDALVEMLEPLSAVLDFILAGGNLEITFAKGTTDEDKVTLLGYDGYNNAIIPLLEALGCTVEANPESELKATLNALVGLINKLTTNDPAVEKDGFIYGVIDLLPGVLYFLTSNGLSTTIVNLLQPVFVILDTIRPIYDLDLNALINGIEIEDKENGTKQTLAQLLGAEIDFEQLHAGFVIDLVTGLTGLDLAELEALIYDAAKYFAVDYSDTAKSTLQTTWKKGAYNSKFDQVDMLTVLLSFILEWATVADNAAALDELLNTNGLIEKIGTVLADAGVFTYETPEWMYMLKNEDGTYDEAKFEAYVNGEALPTTLAAIDWDNIGANDWDKETAQYFANNIGELVDIIIAMINTDEDAPKTLSALLNALVYDNLGEFFTDEKINELIGMLQGILANVDDVLLNVGYKLLNVDLAGLKKYSCDKEINTLAGFVDELAYVLDTYAAGLIDLLFFGDDIRLAKKSDNTDTIVINGGLGYEKGLAMILEALGCDVPTVEDATATTVLKSLTDRVDEILANPVNEILDLLPNLVYFLNANGAGVAVNNLLKPVNALLDKINALGLMDPIDLEALLTVEIGGEEVYILENLALENVVTIVEGATGLPLDAAADILVGFSTGTISEGQYIYKMEAAREDVITILLVVAAELIYDEDFAAALDEMLGTDIIAQLKDVFAESEIVYEDPNWSYWFDSEEEFEAALGTELQITLDAIDWANVGNNDWDKETAKYFAENIGTLVDTVIAMINTDEDAPKTLAALLNGVVYDNLGGYFTADTINELIGMLQKLLANVDDKLLAVGYELLNVDLVGLKKYSCDKEINDLASFVDELAYVLDTYAAGLIDILFFGDDIRLVKRVDGSDAIVINGGEGYAEGLALILEALGCELPVIGEKDKAAAVLGALVDRIEDILENPVDEIIGLLPNLVYFLNADGAGVAVRNLLVPVNALIEKINALKLMDPIDLEDLLTIEIGGEDVYILENLALENVVTIVEGATGLPLDAAEAILVDFCTGKITKGTYIYNMNAAPEDTITILLVVALELIYDDDFAAKLDEMLGTDGLVTGIKGVLAPSNISYGSINWNYTADSDGDYMLTYPNNWNKDTAKAVTALLKDKDFEALIAGLIDKNYDSFSALLNDKVDVFTADTLNSIVGLIANLLGGIDEGLLKAAGVLLDVNVAGLTTYKCDKEIKNVKDFATELADVLNTYASGVVEWLLLGRDYRFIVKDNSIPVDYITISGANGYTEGLAVLLEALGVAAPAVTVKNGEVDTEATIKAVLGAVADRIDAIFANPVEEVINLLPNIIYFLNTNGVAVVVDNTLAALTALLDKLSAFGLKLDINELVNLPKLMGVADKYKENDDEISLDNITISSLLTAVSYMIEDLDLTIIEEVLVGFNLGTTATYTTVSSTEADKAKKMTCNDYDTVTIIANLLLLTIKDEDNAAFVENLVGKDIYGMITALFDMTNVEIQEFSWMYTSEETGGNRVGQSFSTLETSTLYNDWPLYGPLYTEEMATYIADNFGEFVDNILYLLGLEINGVQINDLTTLINELLDGSLYNSSNVIAIRDALAGVLAKVANLEVDGKNIGKHVVAVLKAAKIADLDAVATVEVPEFSEDRAQFVASLCDVLEPLYGALKWLLADEDLSFFVDTDGTDLVTLVGGEGYAYGIIPLLEVLECEGILAPDEYYAAVAANGDVLLTSILDPLLNRVDVIIENPADEILAMLPNIFYFINSNGVDTVVKNTLNAVYSLLKVIEPIAAIDLYKLIGFDFKTINMNWLVNKLLEILEDAGYDFDVKDLDPIAELTVGTLTEYTSKNTKTAYKMVYTPDGEISGGKKELVTVILRLAVTFLMHEKNAQIVVDFLADNLGMSADAKDYIDGVIKSIAKVPTTTYLGMDQALATIYYLFYGADIGVGGVAGGVKDINAEWQKILKELSVSDDPEEETIGSILKDLMDKYTGDVLEEEGVAPNGFIKFFQKIADWFNSIIEWFKNLFN